MFPLHFCLSWLSATLVFQLLSPGNSYPHPNHKQILLALPPKHIQNSPIFQHLHHHHSNASYQQIHPNLCHSLLTGFALALPFCHLEISQHSSWNDSFVKTVQITNPLWENLQSLNNVLQGPEQACPVTHFTSSSTTSLQQHWPPAI